MGDRWDALADDLVRGAQESFVADLTRLTEDMLRRGVHNPDMFAVLARDARQAALGVWARWSGKVSRQAERAFSEALQEQDEELLAGIERAGVPPLHPDDGNWARNRIGEAARGMAEIMRRQNVAFADTQADLWYDVTAQAVTRTLGGEPRDSVMQRAVSRLAAKGLETVDYRSGVRTSIDAAVRRHVVTQSNQCRNDLLDRRCGQYGIDLVMVSAHYGARPSHAVWQGGVYSRSGAKGKYRGLAEATGYGTVGGLCGAGCRHTMTPYIEGVSKPQGTDFAAQQRVTGLTSDQYYEAVQQQRAAERRIRGTKRQIAALEEDGLDTAELRVTLGKQQAELRRLVDDNHLTRDYSREKAYGVRAARAGSRGTAEWHPSGERGISSKRGKNASAKVDMPLVKSKAYKGKFAGLTGNPDADKALWKACVSCLTHRNGTDGEDLYLVSAVDGAVKATNTSSGSLTGIPVNRSMADAFRENDRYTLFSVHNHPSNVPPTGSDLSAAGYRGYAGGVVALHDGDVYYYSCRGATPFSGSSFDTFVESYRKKGYSTKEAFEKALDDYADRFGIEWRKL